MQEALTNVARHAEARHVDILLDERDRALVLEVCDDGKGIRPEDVSDPRSLGLVGIRERARRLGGTAAFEKREPRGTAIRFLFPQPT